jgi:DNA polymerase (family 10)
MQNHEIANIFDEVADMLEVSEDNFFRVRAYRNAARTIRDCSKQLADMRPEAIQELPGIGADLADKIATILKTGALPLHRELQRKVTPGLIELLRVPGLGPKRVRALGDKLKVRNLSDLKKAAQSGAVATLRGFGPKMQHQILQHLTELERHPAVRTLYSEAALVVEQLFAHMRKSRAVERIEAAGSFRRRKETVGDLDLLAISSKPAAVMDQLVSFPGVAEVVAKGETKTSVALNGGLHVDLRVVPRQSYGAAMVYFTGSQAHGVHLRRIAQKQGLLLNEYGLYRGDVAIAGAKEEEIYAKLGLRFIPPELREDRGEVEAAAAGKLPVLLERDDIRGDLHTHTTYTDGRASLEQMAKAARERGLDYIAITDHSRRVAMAHGLDPKRLAEQWREIERVQKTVGGIKLLRGIEVDILDDGSLDLPDGVLAELDWVVASVHYKLEQKPAEMTRRIIKAIRNRHVDVLGHPSGRLLNRRAPSEFDLAEVLRVAREEGCAMEINCQPERLDLTDGACLSAKRAGVKMVVSTDAHHPHDFEFIEYGLNQARRGWIEAGDVLNTRPLKKLRQRR